MPVLLATSRHLPAAPGFDSWCAVSGAPVDLGAAKKVADLENLLEAAYEEIADTWLALARELGREPSASLAHTPAAAGYVSDFGLMLAWSRLVEGWAARPERTLVVCDDPWLFRHLVEASSGVEAVCAPPSLTLREARLGARGFLARSRAALRCLRAWSRWRGRRRKFPPAARVLLVYGHPASRASGEDAYFGDLLKRFPDLVRLLHVDTEEGTARKLCRDPRTFSLHAWGSLSAALRLPFCRWRPAAMEAAGGCGWLVRRAAALEGGSGQGAAIRWQQACQRAWLKETRPRLVIWPWENHAWERDLVRSAKENGTATTGYQHATVGRQEWNYSPASNPDSDKSLPDRIACSGQAAAETLVRFGHDPKDIVVAGYLRGSADWTVSREAGAPVFVALPFDREIAEQMLKAVRPLASRGRSFVIKPHPMSPVSVPESPAMTITDTPLCDQTAVSAVIYAATSVGLEAALAGLPVLRFQPEGRASQDVFPDKLPVAAANADGIEEALGGLVPSKDFCRERVWAAPDMEIWRGIVGETG